MPKNAVTDWSTTASLNTDVGGIDIDENCAARNINDAIREVMKQVASGFGTASSPQFTGIELGHATDTTLTRSAAGVLAVEGADVPTVSSTSTLTNKTLTSPVIDTGIELGHATDTTLTRGAAGFIAVEGNRVPSPASQASGDVLYRGATEWERLPKGTAGQVLTMNGGATAPEWAASASLPSQLQAVWDTGTDTTESSITAAKLKAAILTHAASGDTYNRPTSSTLPVGFCGHMLYTSNTDIADGATTSGSNVRCVVSEDSQNLVVSEFNMRAAAAGIQTGTWRNISGSTLDANGTGATAAIGLMVRES
jgi:hypothetical protein